MNSLVEEALCFSSIRHGGQFRKGSSIPFLSHPFSVAMLLESDHQAPVVVAAGLLHDVIEDTKTDPQEILSKFGSDVHRLVLAVSEKNRDESWEQRKRLALQQVKSLQFDEVALLVSMLTHFIEDEWLQESAPLCQTAYELREIVARETSDEAEISCF